MWITDEIPGYPPASEPSNLANLQLTNSMHLTQVEPGREFTRQTASGRDPEGELQEAIDWSVEQWPTLHVKLARASVRIHHGRLAR